MPCLALLCFASYTLFNCAHHQVSDSTIITQNGVSGPLHTLPEFKRRLKTIIEVDLLLLLRSIGSVVDRLGGLSLRHGLMLKIRGSDAPSFLHGVCAAVSLGVVVRARFSVSVPDTKGISRTHGTGEGGGVADGTFIPLILL